MLWHMLPSQMMTIFAIIVKIQRNVIIDPESKTRIYSHFILPSRFLPIYAQVIHNAGASSWERSDPIIPETGLPMISGGQGLGFEEAEVMSAVDRKELSKRSIVNS